MLCDMIFLKTIKTAILLYLKFGKVPEYYKGRNEGGKKREWDAAYQV